MHTYLDYLQYVAEVGTQKVPRLLSFIEEEQKLLVEYKDLLVFPPMPEHAAFEPSEAELALETKIMATRGGHEGKFLDALRTGWAFIQANPWILQLLLKV